MAEEVKKILEEGVDKSMKGMNMTYPMAYHGRTRYSSWMRPKDALDNLSNEHILPQVSLEQKKHWPVGTENYEIPRKELSRQHHKVSDPKYIVPPSKKESLPPQPVYPQSRGIKLRDVDSIVKDAKYLKRRSELVLQKKQQQQNNFKKPEASRQSSQPASEDNNSVASILHDICAASQPQPKTSTSSSSHNSSHSSSTATYHNTSTRVPSKMDQRTRVSKTSTKKHAVSTSHPTSSSSSSALSAIKKAASSKPRPNLPSTSTSNLSDTEIQSNSKINNTHAYTNLIKARSNLLNDDHFQNRAITDLRRAKEQTNSDTRPNLPIHIIPFDDLFFTILHPRDVNIADEPTPVEVNERKRPLTEKTRSKEHSPPPPTSERRKMRKTTGGKVVPPREDPRRRSKASTPTRELEEGETISPSPSPIRRRLHTDEEQQKDVRKTQRLEERKSRFTASPTRRSESPITKKPRSPRRRSRSPPSRSRRLLSIDQRNASRSPIRNQNRSERSASRSSEQPKSSANRKSSLDERRRSSLTRPADSRKKVLESKYDRENNDRREDRVKEDKRSERDEYSRFDDIKPSSERAKKEGSSRDRDDRLDGIKVKEERTKKEDKLLSRDRDESSSSRLDDSKPIKEERTKKEDRLLSRDRDESSSSKLDDSKPIKEERTKKEEKLSSSRGASREENSSSRLDDSKPSKEERVKDQEKLSSRDHDDTTTTTTTTVNNNNKVRLERFKEIEERAWKDVKPRGVDDSNKVDDSKPSREERVKKEEKVSSSRADRDDNNNNSSSRTDDSKPKEDRVKREERSKDLREERSKEDRPSSSSSTREKKKKSSDDSVKRSSKASVSLSKDTASEKVSTPQLKSRSSSSASVTEATKDALLKQSTSSQKNSPSLSSKPSPAESNASKASTSSSNKPGLSATAPNAESPEQYRVFTVMFKKLAHYNKKQGDSTGSNPSDVARILDHLHSLCNYVLSFYYIDKQVGDKQHKQSIASWQSLFPFADAIIRNLETKNHPDLLAIAKRLIALARFQVFTRMESILRPTVNERAINQESSSSKSDSRYFQEIQNMMSCCDKAQRLNRDSEKVLNYASLQTEYPETFRKVCIEGDLSGGITLGGEAGVAVSPLYPFAPFTSQLNHAAIAAKCLLAEYVEKNHIKYEVITDVKDFM